MRLGGMLRSLRMQARWARHCMSRPERHAVPHCYQQLHAAEPEGEASSNGLEGGLKTAGVLGEGGQGAAWDPCGAETAAAPVQGPPLSACRKGHVGAALLIRHHSRSAALRNAPPCLRLLRMPGYVGWQHSNTKSEGCHCSTRRTCCCEILRVPIRGHQIHTPN